MKVIFKKGHEIAISVTFKSVIVLVASVFVLVASVIVLVASVIILVASVIVLKLCTIHVKISNGVCWAAGSITLSLKSLIPRPSSLA